MTQLLIDGAMPDAASLAGILANLQAQVANITNVKGTISAGQVAYGTGTNTITGNADFQHVTGGFQIGAAPFVFKDLGGGKLQIGDSGFVYTAQTALTFSNGITLQDDPAGATMSISGGAFSLNSTAAGLGFGVAVGDAAGYIQFQQQNVGINIGMDASGNWTPLFGTTGVTIGTSSSPWAKTYSTAYFAGNVAGVDFSGAITNLTVVKGIVTAAS